MSDLVCAYQFENSVQVTHMVIQLQRPPEKPLMRIHPLINGRPSVITPAIPPIRLKLPTPSMARSISPEPENFDLEAKGEQVKLRFPAKGNDRDKLTNSDSGEYQTSCTDHYAKHASQTMRATG